MAETVWFRPLVALAVLAGVTTTSAADSFDLRLGILPPPVPELTDFVSLPSAVRQSTWLDRGYRAPGRRSAERARPGRYRDPWSLRMETERAKFRPQAGGASPDPAPPSAAEALESASDQVAESLFPEMEFSDDGPGDVDSAEAAAVLALAAGFDGGEGVPTDGPAVPEAARAVAQYLAALSDGAMQLVFNFRWLVGKGMRLETSYVVLGSQSELNPRATQERKAALERDRQAGEDEELTRRAAIAKTQKVVRSVTKIVLGILIGLVGWFIIRSF